MTRVLAITVALSAILFVAFARPQDEAAPEPEAPAEEATTESSGGETTANPCALYEQCMSGGGQMAPVQGGLASIPGVGGAMQNQTMQCDAFKQACAQQGGPAGGAGGMSPPPMNTSNPIGGVPTEIPGLAPPTGMPIGGVPTEIPGLAAPTGMPIAIPGMPAGRR